MKINITDINGTRTNEIPDAVEKELMELNGMSKLDIAAAICQALLNDNTSDPVLLQE